MDTALNFEALNRRWGDGKRSWLGEAVCGRSRSGTLWVTSLSLSFSFFFSVFWWGLGETLPCWDAPPPPQLSEISEEKFSHEENIFRYEKNIFRYEKRRKFPWKIKFHLRMKDFQGENIFPLRKVENSWSKKCSRESGRKIHLKIWSGISPCWEEPPPP